MKIKPQFIALIGILFIGLVLGILSFGANNIGYLFSRSIDLVTQVQVDEGAEPRPAIESLDDVDTISQEQQVLDTKELLEQLRNELTQVQDNPEKALEIRRRIQTLESPE